MGDPERITTHRLSFGQAEVLDSVLPESVDLIVTSPPYPMIEMWDSCFSNGNKETAEALARGKGFEAFELMHRDLDKVWGECKKVLQPGGFMCINIGDATRTVGSDFALYPNHARISTACVRLGLTPLPEIIWRKQTNAPNKFMGSGTLPAGAYVTLEHEYILIFRKGGKRLFDNPEEKSNRQESSIFWEERNNWFSDLWDFKGERQTAEDSGVSRRTAAFPYELPFRLISMYSSIGDFVLDPFAGTATTLLASIGLARNSIGFENDQDIYQLALRRLRRPNGDITARNLQRLSEHNSFVTERLARDKLPSHTNECYGFPVVTRQERSLRLYTVSDVREDDSGAFRVSHSPLAPPHKMLDSVVRSSARRGTSQVLESWT